MAKDITTTGGDLDITGGDLRIAEADTQNIDHLLQAHPGELIEKPFLGVGIAKRKNSPTTSQALAIEIRKQLKADGYTVGEVRVKADGSIDINASR